MTDGDIVWPKNDITQFLINVCFPPYLSLYLSLYVSLYLSLSLPGASTKSLMAVYV